MLKYLVVLTALPLLAHDTYLMPQKFRAEKGEKILLSVHNGDSFPNSEEPVDPARLLNLQTPGAAAESFRILGKATHALLTLNRTGTLVLSLNTQPRVFELDGAKFESYLKEEGLSHVSEWRAGNGASQKPAKERYSKYPKTLIAAGTSDDGWKQPTGAVIEILPEADPFALAAGQDLPVIVLWRGKPAAGLQIEAAWSAGSDSGSRIIGRTGDDGRIRVPITAAAKWRLHTVAMEKCADPSAADWESFWASLTFEVR